MSNNALMWGGDTSSDDRTWAMLSHVSTFVLPIFGPLIIYLIKKDTSRFAAYHALQALVFQVIAALLSGATCGIGLLLLIVPIVWAVKANNGEWAGYPLLEGIGRD